MASPRSNWIIANSHREMILINSILLAIQQGHGKTVYWGQEPTDAGWDIALDTFKAYSQVQTSLHHMKRRFIYLRQMYLIFLAMKDSGKFDWDDDTGTPTASEYTWERYLAHKYKERKFKNKNMRWFLLFQHLMSDAPIVGNFALTADPSVTTPPDHALESCEASATIGESAESVSSSLSAGVISNVVLQTNPDNDECSSLNHLSAEDSDDDIPMAVEAPGNNHDSITAAENVMDEFTSTANLHGLEPLVSGRVETCDAITNAPALTNQYQIAVAISLFREVYTTRFDSTYTALGLKVLEDEHLAKQFCSMKAGVARDLWILVKINLYRAQSGL